MAKKGKNSKKSKGKTIKGPKSNTSGDNGASPSQCPNKMEMMELPENGWICEKDEAAKAVKCERNKKNILRLARAYCKLRQWEKLEALASSALKDDDHSRELDSESSANSSSNKLYRQQLTIWHKEAKDNLSIKTQWNEQGEGCGLEERRLRLLKMDTFTCVHTTFNNFNILHYAAYQGDIRLLEKAIALGAAIDCPVDEPKEECAQQGEEAPRGATALLLACASLAMYSMMPREHRRMIFQEQPRIADMLRGNLECAVQLVKLGANCSAVYRLGNCGGTLFALMKPFGIDNKNAYQLANIAKKLELTRTMEIFKSADDKIRLVHCRCGSRLPWRECHASPTLAPEPHYYYLDNTGEQGGEKVLSWRFSPLGDCPCGNNKNKYKRYFKCCWEDTIRYQKDSTGQLYQHTSVRIDASVRIDECIELHFQQLQESMLGEGPNDSIFPPITKEEILSECMKMTPERMMKLCDPDGISVLCGWDIEVYVGVMERIENWFEWNDLHWALPKSELIQRTKEWNHALLQYCNDLNLIGIERDQVIKIHTASALAPCANPACHEFEVDIKSFAKCSRCKKVAYCSRACQGDHWKLSHKKNCCPDFE